MNNKIKKSASALIIALMLSFMLMPAVVYADEAAGEASIRIPVTVNATGEAPAEFQYEFQIESMTAGAPMPSNTTLTITDLTKKDEIMTADGEFIFAEDAFSVPDDYNYRITQITQSSEGVKTLDNSVYYITIRVLNGENGNQVVVWAQKNEDGSLHDPDEKWGKDSIVYTNEFDPPEKAEERTYSAVRTGDEANVILWGALAVGAAGCAGLLLSKKQRGR
ncbi:MAG: FctA domain-containing protein [Lachnospiraceae bacterium]|nr:FctA domain-containing protein [Lachnospiraceae bacterium]